MTTQSIATQSFINNYTLSKSDFPWFAELKEEGFSCFSKVGIPSVKSEIWKYTSLKNIESVRWKEAPLIEGDVQIPCHFLNQSHKIVLVNGCFSEELSDIGSLPEGAFVGSLKDAIISQHPVLIDNLGTIARSDTRPLVALNTAHISDGLVIFLNKATLNKDIEIVYIGSPGKEKVAYHPRSLIILDGESEATILEQYLGSNSSEYFSNCTAEIDLKNGSKLNHNRLFCDGDKGNQLVSTEVRVGKGARYRSFTFSSGGSLLRNDMCIRLADIGAKTRLGGVYLAADKQHVDHTTAIHHERPQTVSNQTFKGVLNNSARGVFQGNIVVHKGADGADGKLNNRALLLSPGAEANSKPQLEVYADDVQCSHGSTVGALEEDAIFYLRSRGIPYVQAKALLVEGFLSEVIEEQDLGEVGTILRAQISEWMRID